MMGPLSRWWESSRVDVYTVHEPPEAPADRLDRAERLVFLRDGFSWGALLFGPLWLAASRAWLGLLAYLAAALVIGTALALLEAGELWSVLSSAAMNVYLGFEGASFKRWALERQGWSELGTVSGKNIAECERRFFESWLPGEPAIARREAGQSAGTLAAGAGSLMHRLPYAPASGGWRSPFKPRS